MSIVRLSQCLNCSINDQNYAGCHFVRSRESGAFVCANRRSSAKTAPQHGFGTRDWTDTSNAAKEGKRHN